MLFVQQEQRKLFYFWCDHRTRLEILKKINYIHPLRDLVYLNFAHPKTSLQHFGQIYYPTILLYNELIALKNKISLNSEFIFVRSTDTNSIWTNDRIFRGKRFILITLIWWSVRIIFQFTSFNCKYMLRQSFKFL